MHIKRLASGDREQARELFAVLADVFGSERQPLSDNYLDHLLDQHAFWAVAAFVGDDIVGGITAHTIPMTTSEMSEIFIYDVAVKNDYQRKGVGRLLLTALRERAAADGIHDVFVLADNDDMHALDFYRGLNGIGSASTLFLF